MKVKKVLHELKMKWDRHMISSAFNVLDYYGVCYETFDKGLRNNYGRRQILVSGIWIDQEDGRDGHAEIYNCIGQMCGYIVFEDGFSPAKGKIKDIVISREIES